jgi:hypothetical protein
MIDPTLFLNGRTGLRTHIGFKLGERNIQHGAFGDDYCPLHHILQFPDIAGLMIPKERLHCLGRNGVDRAIVSAAEFLNEVTDQQWNVFGPLA